MSVYVGIVLVGEEGYRLSYNLQKMEMAMKKLLLLLLVIFLMVITSGSIWAVTTPVTISPGTSQVVSSASECCPTFSWSAVKEADGYEIAVFVVDDPGNLVPDILYDELMQLSEPVLSANIPAPALSWTPSRDQAFTPSQTYAWCIRSQKLNRPGEWSDTAFFKIPETTITNLDDAVNKAVTDFLTEDETNLSFWSGLENRIEEIVTDKVTASEMSASVVPEVDGSYPRGGSENDGLNVYYGEHAAQTIIDNPNTLGKTNDNVFIGKNAGWFTYYDGGVSLPYASYNVFVGNGSGYNNTRGHSNSFLGFDSGKANTTGYYNSFFGRSSGFTNFSGDSNSFFGYESGRANYTGYSNSFFGRSSGLINSTGHSNSFFGKSSGRANYDGYSNSFFDALVKSRNKAFYQA